MSSTVGMDLSILKLTSPRRRKIHSARFTFDNDLAPTYGTSNIMSPHGSSPSSPLWGGPNRVTVDDDMLTIFEQHRAAIPFKWEEFPGTCRDDASATANGEGLKSVSESEQELSSCLSNSSTVSRSSSGGTGSLITTAVAEVEDDDDDDDDEEAVVEDHTVKRHLNTTPSSDANASLKNSGSRKDDGTGTEVLSKGQGQILPLKPPPGMSIKQLLNFGNDERSIINSSKPRARRSFRRDGLKALPFLASSSPKRDHHKKGGSLPCTMLGFEEWPKVVQEQEKQLQQQEENQRDKEDEHHHRRVSSVTRFSFSFRKKPTTAAKESSSSSSIDFLDGDDDDIFNEDFGKKGGLMDRRPLTSLSSRNLADGYRHFKNRSWVYDSDTDYSDCETDTTTKMDYFDTSHVIAEGDEKDEQPQQPQQDTNSKDHLATNSVSTELLKEKRKKKHHRNPLTRVLGLSSSSNSSGKDHHPRQAHQKPSRLSAVSPAPPPPPPGAPSLAPVRSDLKQKTALHGSSSASNNPLLKMCLSTVIGQALIKNVKHLRSFEFHTPRALTAK